MKRIKQVVIVSFPILILACFITYSLYLFQSQNNTAFSFGVEQAVIPGDSGFNYQENRDILLHDGYFMTTYQIGSDLFLNKVNVDTGEMVNIKIDYAIDNPKGVYLFAREDSLEMYVHQGSKVVSYILDMTNGVLSNETMISDDVEIFKMHNDYIAMTNEAMQLIVMYGDKVIYQSEGKVDRIAMSQGDSEVALFINEVTDEKYARLLAVNGEVVDELYRTDEINMVTNDRKYNSVFKSGNDIGFIIKQDNKPKDVSFAYTYISNDGGKNFTQHTYKRNWVSSDFVISQLEGTKYAFIQALHGDLCLTQFDGSELVGIERYVRRDAYMSHGKMITKDGQSYVQWFENEGATDKIIAYATTNPVIIEKAAKLDSSDYALLGLNTVVLIFASSIPTTIIIAVFAMLFAPILIILKFKYKDDMLLHINRICMIVGISYTVILMIMMSGYMIKFYDKSMYASFINPLIYGAGILPIMGYSYLYGSSYMKTAQKEATVTGKLARYMILSLVLFALYTMPSIALSLYGYKLF